MRSRPARSRAASSRSASSAERGRVRPSGRRGIRSTESRLRKGDSPPRGIRLAGCRASSRNALGEGEGRRRSGSLLPKDNAGAMPSSEIAEFAGISLDAPIECFTVEISPPFTVACLQPGGCVGPRSSRRATHRPAARAIRATPTVSRSPRATGGPIASAVRSRIRTRSCERGERRDLTRAFAKGTNVILRNHFAA